MFTSTIGRSVDFPKVDEVIALALAHFRLIKFLQSAYLWHFMLDLQILTIAGLLL